MAPNREPWLAALLGITFPGAGHVYAGARAAGLAQAAAAVALVAAAAGCFYAPRGSVVLGWVALGLLIALNVFSSAAAHRLAAGREEPEVSAGRRGRKDAWKAVFLSGLFPGIGQFYSGRPLQGVAFVVAALLASLADRLPLAPLYALVRGAAMLEAWSFGDSRRRSPDRLARGVVIAVALLFAGQLTLIAYVRGHWVRAFRVASGSMAPTLRPGDRVFVDLTRRGRAGAGDVVAVPRPGQPKQLYLYRCIAVAGQIIEVRDKIVRVDGHALEEPYARHVDPEVRPEAGPRDNMPRFTVPEGHVFVMGDNRENSNDSRFWGPVETRTVVGRAYKVYWPLDAAGPLPGR